MNLVWSSENIVTAVLVGFALLFWALEKVARSVLTHIQSAVDTTTGPLTPAQLEKYSRVASADFVLKFLSILMKTTATLGLALGIFKVFSDLYTLVLPDRTFGLAVLMCYCGLFAIIGIVVEDLNQALSKLFRPDPQHANKT